MPELVTISPPLQWRMDNGDLAKQWHPLGHQLYAGGLGRLTMMVATEAMFCFTGHLIAPRDLYISCTLNEGRSERTIYCLDHTPRRIVVEAIP